MNSIEIDQKHKWAGPAKIFHWSIAALILLTVPAGYIMSKTYMAVDPYARIWQYWTSNYHHTAGLIILTLAIARLAWRLLHRSRSGKAEPDKGWKPKAAAISHWILYGLLFVIPLSGWAAISALADSAEYGATYFWFFGTNGFDTFIPRIVPPLAFDDAEHLLTYSFLAASHRWLLWIGGFFLFLHVAAALHHHFIIGDDTLRNMLPKRKVETDQAP